MSILMSLLLWLLGVIILQEVGRKMGDAFFDWRIKPAVDAGNSIAGGVSYHFMGSGSEVEVWQCYNSLIDFATSVTSLSPQGDAAKES